MRGKPLTCRECGAVQVVRNPVDGKEGVIRVPPSDAISWLSGEDWMNAILGRTPRVPVQGPGSLGDQLLEGQSTLTHIPHINPTRCVVISNICT